MRFFKSSIIALLLFVPYLVYNNPIKIKILFTCDTNGRPLSFTHMQDEGQGGIPARATLIKKLAGDRRKNNVLILDTGSIFNGRLESNLYNGDTDIAGIDTILYDAIAIGITELQRPKAEFEKINQNCEFHYLSANVSILTFTKREQLLSDDFYSKKFGGYKGVTVGVFSVITEDAKQLIGDSYKNDYIIADPIRTAKDMVLKLKNQEKVDIVIGLTHMGYYPDDPSAIDSKALANNVKGIDLIIDGRTGINMTEPAIVNNIPIFQVMRWGLFVGEINLVIDNNKLKSYTFASHPVNYKVNGQYVGEKLEEDAATLRNIKSKMRNFDKLSTAKISSVDGGKSFELSNIRFAENEFGNLICDALLDYTKADIAFQNTGGINHNEKIDSLNLNRLSFDKVLPYDNSVVTLNATGDEIIDILEYSISRKGYGSFLQVGGIKFSYDSSGKVKEVLFNDQNIDRDKTYKVVINSWLAIGGDGYEVFKNNPKKFDFTTLTREVLYNYIEKIKVIKPSIQGRINYAE